jgi:hypothetical protein
MRSSFTEERIGVLLAASRVQRVSISASRSNTNLPVATGLARISPLPGKKKGRADRSARPD